MAITASGLRQNIYKLLDQVINTGTPLEINRKGNKLKVITVRKNNKLKNLKRRDIIKCNPEKLVHIDWSSEWKK